MIRYLLALLPGAVLIVVPASPFAAETPSEGPTGTIATETTAAADERLQKRLSDLFSVLDELREIDVSVNQGVVSLSGSVANEATANRAIELASRLEGVVTVEDDIERTRAVGENLTPMMRDVRDRLEGWVRALPLVGMAIMVAALIMLLGHLVGGATSLWQRLSPNTFIAELIGQSVRVVLFLIGIGVGLSIIGASALIGTLLGGAGLVGIAIGFAVRDTFENYISSIMLSLRQPFRANEHVVIDGHEGRVVRLTTRATVLMTLDGNHLRIPNAQVYKAVILNYSRNPQRQFTFRLGIDTGDDPLEATRVGVETLRALPWVLSDPEPTVVVDEVGDSNIVLRFLASIDQRETDFLKARSMTISASKSALEDAGFALPEPIYRLRVEDQSARTTSAEHPPKAPKAASTPEAAQRTEALRPDPTIAQKVEQERATADKEDLLDDNRPIE